MKKFAIALAATLTIASTGAFAKQAANYVATAENATAESNNALLKDCWAKVSRDRREDGFWAQNFADLCMRTGGKEW